MLISSLLTIGACCIAGQLPVVLDIIEASHRGEILGQRSYVVCADPVVFSFEEPSGHPALATGDLHRPGCSHWWRDIAVSGD